MSFDLRFSKSSLSVVKRSHPRDGHGASMIQTTGVIKTAWKFSQQGDLSLDDFQDIFGVESNGFPYGFRSENENGEQNKKMLYFFSEGWNIFDFVVVAIGILSVLKVPGAASMGMHTHRCCVPRFRWSSQDA